ncbi:MAG: dATP pyrophosphohydrolase [Caulobacter sp. 12-67-6]|nr:MAG: dATP pyrophosphohydrolase [Caulobacter sp. 12-67-6]
MPFDSHGADITIVPVRTRAELTRFIKLPIRLNAGDPNWITPLMMERAEALSPKTNPFFEHAEVQLWLAVRGGRDVGRISAQIDALAPQTPGLKTGNFGLIAAEDDAVIFSLLFRAAEDWLRARGCVRALGPFNLSVNEEVGLLVDGFDTPPMVMMGHDPAYTGGRVEEQGYAKAKDVYAYLCDPTADLPAVVVALGDRIRLNNWDEAAFIVLLPNVNEAIADLKGKLLPFGWAKLLWRLKVSGVKSARVPLMGVKRKFADTMRGQLLPFHLMNAGRNASLALGYTQFEFSWVLEENMPMRRISEAMGATIYKTYRIYEKTL